MTKMEPPEYSGIFLEPEEIEYQEIDPPLRKLINLINSKSWLRTYGCCAGQSHHLDHPGDEKQFFLGLFVEGEKDGIDRLQSWLEEANRLNGPTGLRAEAESVHQHPFGQGSVDGWYAYRITANLIRGIAHSSPPQAHLRMIKSLETALEKFGSVS